MNNPANPKCNAEGYNDPTAFYGTQKIVREESETEGGRMSLSRC